MSDRTKIQRNKGNTSSVTNPSLASSTTATLANPTHSFGLQSTTALPETSLQALSNQQDTQSANEQLPEGEAFKQQPLGHDLSRISLRPQAKLSTSQLGNTYEPQANWLADDRKGGIFPEVLQRKCAGCEDEEEELQRRTGSAIIQRDETITLAPVSSPISIQQDGLKGQLMCEDDGNPQPTDIKNANATPMGAGAGNSITNFSVINKTRSVSGKTLSQMWDNMTSSGTKESASVLPELKPDPQYEYDENNKVTKVTVNVRETKEMPQWAELDQQCQPIKNEWNRFYSALAQHEEKHISIDRKYYTNVDQKVVGKPQQTAWDTLDKVVEAADQENIAYDTSSNHGIAEGAKINASVQCGVEKLNESGNSSLENAGNIADIPSTDSTTLMGKRTSQSSSISQLDRGHDLSKISMLPMQAKLTISQPNDPYEQEADRVANEVMQMQIPESNETVAMRSLQETISRKCAVCEREDLVQPKLMIQRSGDRNLPVAGDIESRLNSSKGGGSPLSNDVRSFMEPRFGADFSSVKVHTDAAAVQMNKDLNAQAFAHGSDVYFGAGKSPGNNELTAHELTHVVQQTGKVQTHKISKVHLKGEPSIISRSTAVSKTDPIDRLAVAEPAPKTIGISHSQLLSRKQNDLQPSLMSQQAEDTRSTITTPKHVESLQQPHGNSNAEPMIQRIPSLDDLTNFGEAAGFAIVDELAPELVPILRKGSAGMFEWMKDLIGSSLESVFNGLMAPVRSIAGVEDGLAAHFAPILTSFQTAAKQIASNDCSPISEAAGQLEQAAEKLILPIVEKIQPIVTKIKDFLSGIWDKIGAPIWGWIKDYAGEKWAEIQKLGEMLSKLAKWIWEKGGYEKVWIWLKNKLGIGDGVEGQNGILQWVQRKVEEAWTALKKKLEPFEKELKTIGTAVAGVALAVSPAGPVLAVGAAVYGAVQGLRWISANWGKGDAIVKSREYLEKTLIPSLKGAANKLGDTFKKIAGSLSSALGSLAESMVGAVGAIGGSLLKAATSAVQWIADQVQALANWAQQQLNDLSQWVEEAMDKLQTFLQKMLDLFMEVGNVILDIWLLPAFLGKTVWTAIPECIRDPLIDFIGPIILRQIEIFQALARDNDAWQKTKKDVQHIVHLVFEDRDLMGAIKATFNLILRVFNIPPDLLSTVIAKAEGAWDVVSKDPLEFIKNVVRTIGKGFGLLWDNIGEHLKFGLMGWLTGGLAENNITLPQEWGEPKQVFGFVMDVMGLTADHMWARLEKQFDEKKVRQLRKRIGQVSRAIEWIDNAIDTTKSPAENTAGIIEQAKDFGMNILTGIAEWVATQVSVELAELAAAAAASGGLSEVLDAVRRIYKAILTAVRWARNILDMVNETLNDITSIAGGNIAAAGAKLEQIMHRGMPVVIGFLADQVGLGGIGTAIRNIVEKIRETVDKAIDWVISKLKAGIKGLIGAVGLGGDEKKKDSKKDGKYDGQIGKEVKFTVAQESHRIWIGQQGTNAVVMMASEPKPVSEYLNEYEKMAQELQDKEKQTKVITLIGQARRILSGVDTNAKQLAVDAAKPDAKPEEEAAKDDAVESGEDQLVAALKQIRELLGLKDNDYIYEQPYSGHTIKIRKDLKVFQFSSEPTELTGTQAREVQQQALESLVPRTNPSYPTDSLGRAVGPLGHVTGVKDGQGREDLPAAYIGYQPGDHKGHLIADRFYGSADSGNLVPMHQTLNLSTYKTYENTLATAYKTHYDDGKGVLLHMQITPTYPASDASNPASYRPASISATSKIITLQPNTSNLATHEQVYSSSFTNPGAVLTNINVNNASVEELRAAFSTLVANAILEERQNGIFSDIYDLQLRLLYKLGDTKGSIIMSQIISSREHIVTFK